MFNDLSPNEFLSKLRNVEFNSNHSICVQKWNDLQIVNT